MTWMSWWLRSVQPWRDAEWRREYLFRRWGETLKRLAD
jgi:hypothetical protein